jgi:hypothetical protein
MQTNDVIRPNALDTSMSMFTRIAMMENDLLLTAQRCSHVPGGASGCPE